MTGQPYLLRLMGAGFARPKELLEAGKVTPVIDGTYPLNEVREAFRHMMDDELQGKVIVTPAEAV